MAQWRKFFRPGIKVKWFFPVVTNSDSIGYDLGFENPPQTPVTSAQQLQSRQDQVRAIHAVQAHPALQQQAYGPPQVHQKASQVFQDSSQSQGPQIFSPASEDLKQNLPQCFGYMNHSAPVQYTVASISEQTQPIRAPPRWSQSVPESPLYHQRSGYSGYQNLLQQSTAQNSVWGTPVYQNLQSFDQNGIVHSHSQVQIPPTHRKTIPSPSHSESVVDLNMYLQSGSGGPMPIPNSKQSSRIPSASFRSNQPILTDQREVLSPEEVFEIFKTSNQYNSKNDFKFAEGGSVYFYKPENVNQKEDWRGRGGHPWRQGGGTTAHTLRSDPTVTLLKKVASLVTPEKKSGDPRFKRLSWEWEGRPLHVVLQFIGKLILSYLQGYLQPFSNPGS